jgi:hypothetical protein
MELYLPPPRKRQTTKINWTPKMLETLKTKFPVTFNRQLCKELGVSQRSMIRKARELGIEKVPGFLEINRETIIKMAVANNHNKYTGVKGWCVPNSEAHRFKKGQVSLMKNNPELVQKVREKRNQTIKRERIRIRLGLPRLTKLNLK